MSEPTNGNDVERADQAPEVAPPPAIEAPPDGAVEPTASAPPAPSGSSIARTAAAATPELPVVSSPSAPKSSPSATSLPISPPTPTAPRPATPIPIAWRSWPAAESPAEMLVLSAIVVTVPATVWHATGSLGTTILCLAALAAAVSRSFVPRVFEMSALGVTERVLGRTKRIPWISIDRFVVGRNGVFLSSAGAPLELLRGTYVPWSGRREEILATLRYYLSRAEEAHE